MGIQAGKRGLEFCYSRLGIQAEFFQLAMDSLIILDDNICLTSTLPPPQTSLADSERNLHSTQDYRSVLVSLL
ncbi:hypothetical protein DV515_00017709 [Chloebia gouldiae]|uniref:Uncharacterized protein n=1 Tax=Chloebia gouldiae TaxID=44316 RepID=A0A3L8Q9I4_CHLGU|nr:hypothetical protein DV515_00017709 [Chloebia gouldiae]